MAGLNESLLGSDRYVDPIVLRSKWWFNNTFSSVNHMKSTAESSYLFSSCLQRVRRATRLASDSCCARRRLRHLSWRSQWMILWTLERWMPVSRDIWRVDRCVKGLSFWLSTRSATVSMFSLVRAERALPLPGCLLTVPALRIFFKRESILSSFQPLSRNSFNSFRAIQPFDR